MKTKIGDLLAGWLGGWVAGWLVLSNNKASSVSQSVSQLDRVWQYLPITMVRNISSKATEKPELSFQDPESIYKAKKTWELGRAYVVFSLCGINTLMQHNEKMLTIGKKILGDTLFFVN